MLEDEFDHVFLKGHKEDFTGMLHQRHNKLQDAGYIVQHQVITLNLQTESHTLYWN